MRTPKSIVLSPKERDSGNTGNTRITVTDYCGALIQCVCGSYYLTLSLRKLCRIDKQILLENDYLKIIIKGASYNWKRLFLFQRFTTFLEVLI